MSRKNPSKDISKSKGKENTMLTAKDIIKGVNKIIKGCSPKTSKGSIYLKKDSKDSVSPRKRLV